MWRSWVRWSPCSFLALTAYDSTSIFINLQATKFRSMTCPDLFNRSKAIIKYISPLVRKIWKLAWILRLLRTCTNPVNLVTKTLKSRDGKALSQDHTQRRQASGFLVKKQADSLHSPPHFAACTCSAGNFSEQFYRYEITVISFGT